MAAETRRRRGSARYRLVSGEKMRARMKAADLTIREMAELIEFDHRYISDVSRHRHPRVSRRFARNVERVLECPGELFEAELDTDLASESRPDGATAGAA